MKITYITHACLLIETNGLKILTDPWLIGPCWGGTLWHYPTHKYNTTNLPVPDIIYYSHGHDDHYHHPTMKTFPNSWFKSHVVAPNINDEKWKKELKRKFRKCTFINHNQKIQISKKIEFQLFINDQGDPDSSLKITDQNCSLFLQTDNLMSLKEANRISKYGKIDIAFVIPFLTGVFPGFYKMETQKLLEQAKNKIGRSLLYCSKIVKNLKPKYTVPYACDLGYLGEKFHINLLHTHNKTDLEKLLKRKKIATKTKILNSGNFIEFKNRTILKNKITKYKYDHESLIKFANEKNEDYEKYMANERRIGGENYDKIYNKFKDKLTQNLKYAEKFNFITLINIKDNSHYKKSLLIDFKKNRIFDAKHNGNIKSNLRITIESFRLKNLIDKKYPMNFLTFHNGGYTCERANMGLTKTEVKYWNWINNLSF